MLPAPLPPPVAPLYRVGWPPDPLAWPEWRHVGRNRFDDPENRTRVLYLAEQRHACFAEILAKFYLKDPQLIAALRAMPPGAPAAPAPAITSGVIAPGFFGRPMGALRLRPGQNWLDLRSLENHIALYELLIDDLDLHGYGEVQMDLSDVTTRDRNLTQRISRWAISNGYQGIAYTSRLSHAFDCWALFESAVFDRADDPRQITEDDPELLRVVGWLGLTIP